uniref:Uncharacterized protein n=1 Tax=Magallana gigas TaxID=29159 RepID=A0A8W8P6B8_MAGGI
MRSSSSIERIGFSTSEEDDETDKSYTEGKSVDGEPGTFPASKWQYVDLKNANIFYNEKPDSIKQFMQDIKVDILKNFPEIPDFEKSVKKLSSLTKDNLLFSFDLDNTLKHLDDGYAHKNYVEVEWMKQIQTDFVRAEKVDKALDLTNIAVVKRTFIFGDKIVSSVPDLAYGFAPRPIAIQKNVLLFVVEVKGKPVNNVLSECLEDQLDSGVLGQVGSELFAEVPHSVMFPNSMGIICMETKIIFVYLKVKKEPDELLILPLKSKGTIHYTRPYDILKAQDRGEVCEIFYWLGCAQNHCDRELLMTTL